MQATYPQPESIDVELLSRADGAGDGHDEGDNPVDAAGVAVLHRADVFVTSVLTVVA